MTHEEEAYFHFDRNRTWLEKQKIVSSYSASIFASGLNENLALIDLSKFFVLKLLDIIIDILRSLVLWLSLVTKVTPL